MSEDAGELTEEIICRALDDLWNWNQPQRGPRQFGGLLAVLRGEPPSCGVMLFAPQPGMPDAFKAELIATGTPVHPVHARRLAPVQGPQPAVCAREPHPDSPWHWDGRGTWWR